MDVRINGGIGRKERDKGGGERRRWMEGQAVKPNFVISSFAKTLILLLTSYIHSDGPLPCVPNSAVHMPSSTVEEGHQTNAKYVHTGYTEE